MVLWTATVAVVPPTPRLSHTPRATEEAPHRGKVALGEEWGDDRTDRIETVAGAAEAGDGGRAGGERGGRGGERGRREEREEERAIGRRQGGERVGE